MTNQASKDELEQKLLDDKSFQHTLKLVPMSQRELMTFELARYINALIRTEKLKLLAEVRERVVGAKNDLYFKNKIPQTLPEYMDDVVKVREQLRAEQGIELTKLEAEL